MASMKASFAMRLGCSLALGVVTSLVACSRPATENDCEFIVRRVVELRLRTGLDGSAEAKLSADALTSELKEEIRKRCVGKPITDRALQCVRGATKPRQVIECFH
jgi:hypothetical protein